MSWLWRWLPWILPGGALALILTGLSIQSLTHSIPTLRPGQTSIFLEAENSENTFLNQAHFWECENCSGKSKVGQVGNGNRVNIRFAVSEAGRYGLTFHYLNGADEIRSCAMMVNNVSQGKLELIPTKSWGDVSTFRVAVNLRVGENTVGCDWPDHWSVDMDALKVTHDVHNVRTLQPFVWHDTNQLVFRPADTRRIWGFALLFVLGLIAAIAVSIRALRTPAQNSLKNAVAWAGFVIALTMGSYLLDLFDTSVGLSSLATRLRFLGIGVTAAMCVLVALRYSGQSDVFGGRFEVALLTISRLYVVLYATDPWTHLMYTRFWNEANGRLNWEEGVGTVFAGSLSWMLLLTSAALFLTYVPKVSRFYRDQLFLLLAAALSPHVIGNLIGTPLSRMNIYPEIHYVVVGIAVSAIILAWAVFRHQLLDHTPELWGRGADVTSDLAVVIDAQGHVVEGNDAAHQQLQLQVGRTLEEISPEGDQLEINARHYQVSRSQVTGGHGLQGQLIALHDVTNLKNIELELRDANTELEHLRDELREQSIRDKLTGVFNRRHMDTTLDEWLATVRAFEDDLSIVLFDIDHFRQFNARWGHAGGDEVLYRIGAHLLSRASSQFIPCRYGGEEFCIILPGRSLEQARVIAESLREGIRGLEIAFAGRSLEVTISASVASFCSSGEELLRAAADEALRKAKLKGRNRVELPTKPKHTWGTGWG
jgi:diguanylate cyclase (GGDEF)-like protein